jgi:hypothetical protein
VKLEIRDEADAILIRTVLTHEVALIARGVNKAALRSYSEHLGYVPQDKCIMKNKHTSVVGFTACSISADGARKMTLRIT